MVIDTLIFMLSFQPIEVAEYRLDNGLQLLVYEDHFAPVVSTQVHYLVGAYDEPKGLTGMSHMLEHMIFKGTKKYGPKAYDAIIKKAGGENNGYTSVHETCYFANLNRDRYTLELEMEADRMQNCLIRDGDFALERAVVMEELRLNENDPYGSFGIVADQLTFTVHPYRNPVVGYMEDLTRVTRDDLFRWYRANYNPANTVIVVAGDVDPDDVHRQVRKFYGRIRGAPRREEVFSEPPQNGERRFEMKRDVMLPALSIQYHTVPINHEDSYALEIIEMILSHGRSSRFQKNLVRSQELATRLYGYAYHSKYAGLFVIFGLPQIGVEPAALEEAIEAEIEALKKSGVSEEELGKARNRALAQAIYRLDSVSSIGFSLSFWRVYSGDWRNFNEYPSRLQQVTNDDIIRVANKYLDKDNRTVGYLLPIDREEK